MTPQYIDAVIYLIAEMVCEVSEMTPLSLSKQEEAFLRALISAFSRMLSDFPDHPSNYLGTEALLALEEKLSSRLTN